MKCTIRTVTILVVAMLQTLGLGETCAAEARPWYLGLGPMPTRLSIDSDQLNSIISPRLGYPVPETHESRETGVKVYGGFRATPFLAVEAGYAYLGEFAFHVRESSQCEGLPPGVSCLAVVIPGAQGHISVEGWTLSAIGTLPLTDRLELNGRLGLFRSTVKLEGYESGLSSSLLDNTERQTSPLLGVELRYRLAPLISLTLGGEWMNGLGSEDKTTDIDITALTFGIQYNFP